jgi:predicted extracellular nuclease
MIRIVTPCLVLILMCVTAVGSRAQAVAVFINEIHYDNTGADVGEFIEIAGPAGTNLSGYSIELYNGNGGARYDSDALSGVIPDQQNGFGTVSLMYPFVTGGAVQNGAPDGVALVNGTTVIQFLSYEGSFTATSGTANGMTSTDIGRTEAGTEAIGLSLQLKGTGTTYSNFAWAAPSAESPGSINAGQTFEQTATIAINDVSVVEGDNGTVAATYTVTSSGAHSGITFDIATADGAGASGATVADGDYVARAESAEIPAGSTTYTFTVQVNGDVTFEANEQWSVLLSNISSDAAASDGHGTGTITNDDAAPPVDSDVVISQVYGGGGNSGATYTHDFIELFNRGTSPVNLTGWSVQYGGANGTTWAVTPLAGTIDPGEYYLVRQAAGAGGTTPLPTPDATGNTAMSATAGKVALRDSTAAAIGACPAGITADLVGYGGANCAEGLAPASATSNTLAALRKRGGCFDSNHNRNDFSIGSPNPRNSATAARSCGFTTAAIHEIQGNGSATPYLGQDVITSGVVTAIKSNGFFLQTPDGGDGDPATSQALFVFTSAAPAVAVADGVTARGTAGEFFGLTQLDSTLPGDVSADSAANPVPGAQTVTAAMLNPAGPLDQLERFEGMRLHADSLTAVAPTNEFGEIFTVLTGVARPMREPGIEISLPVPPDPTTGTPDCCIPRWDENPERLLVDSDGLAGAARLIVTSHVTLTGVTGPLDYSFGAYKVLPETAPGTSGNIGAAPVPEPLADQFTVAGFNIENFSHGNEVQRRKAALAIRQVLRSPDIIGHIEIRDLASLQALATQVNDDAVGAGEPNPLYEARLIPASPSATQNVGYLVKTSRVQIDAVTQERATETYTNPENGQQETLHDRPPLVLRATVTLPNLTPMPVVVVVNHLRSFIDIEQVEGDGPRVRAKRTVQAESLAGLLQELQTESPSRPVISIGDYNAYEFNDGYTDPIAIIKGMPTPDDQIVVDESPDLVDPNYVNLTDALPEAERYSFIFEGTPQALDHVLVNGTAAALFERYTVARNNADFPEGPVFAGDVTRPERSSDHDMPVAYFAIPDTIDPTVSVTPSLESLWPPNHQLVDVSVTIEASDNIGVIGCGISGVSSSEAGNARGDGNTAVDWIVDGPTAVRLRAERSGSGPGRTYTIAVECTDAAGNIGSATTQVTVSHQGGK